MISINYVVNTLQYEGKVCTIFAHHFLSRQSNPLGLLIDKL